ncbi:putative endonuclease or glycosyl hydrolase [Forsythia ovata]|uniref:Endonuclease or glycosyl hydrolase n=1 Tax=Forsythia ovata TaxID=205694 RepID=A0ABD1UUF2_9LAMI
MIPISPRPIFALSFAVWNPKTTLFKISHFSTSTPSFHSSTSSTYQSRRHEEESRNVRVSVWWDFENCNLPCNVNVFRVAQFITSAIRASGIKGPIQITAFGDIMQLSRANQEALSATGINLNHIPSGGKNSADRSLLVDLVYWVSQNPPPAHLFLISGDRGFAGILHRLRMKNYNILLASPDDAPSILCSAASIMWQWNALVRGENLSGKHFNQPPDAPYGSWYGHSKAPLEDPFAVTEQPSGSHTDELSNSGSDSKLRPIPKAVIKQIRQILNLYPEGILITELRKDLAKSNLIIDRDLYGYKKFSRLLLAMPHILKLQSGSDGQMYARGVNIKISEQDESTPSIYTGPVANKEGSDTVSLLTNPEAKTEAHPRNLQEPSNIHKQKKKMQEPPRRGEEPFPPMELQEVPKKQDQAVIVQDPKKKVEVPSSPVVVLDNATANKSRSHASEEHSSVAEVGISQRMWRKWFGSKDGDADKKHFNKQDEISSGKITVEDKDVISTSLSAKSVCPALFSPSSHEAIIDGTIAYNSDATAESSSQRSSIFSWIMRWSRFWSSPDSDHATEEFCEKVNQLKNDNQKHVVFAEESFWKEMEAFMETSQASALVLQSKTRVRLAQNLQNKGPSVLRSRPLSNLLHLVDLLISDKKWVVECNSQTYPFKLVQPTGKDPFNNHPSCLNGLSSIFQVGDPPSTSQNPQELVDEKHQNIRQPVCQSSSSKSRSEILADCQKLVDHIVKEYPEGFNMGAFRKLFLDKYGYSLDLEKLGYQKLVTLLQIMPGVRIESNYIVPAGEVSKNIDLKSTDLHVQESNVGTVAHLDSELSDTSRKDDDPNSPWEELAPVANSGPKKDETVGPTLHDYEPLPDNDFSDSEDETSSSKSDGGDKSRMDVEDSSLLQILDSWYSSKDHNSRKDAPENVTKSGLKPSASSGLGTKNGTATVNHARRQKSTKSYSFVSELPRNNKDRLIDGILGSLKKSGEKSTESRVPG